MVYKLLGRSWYRVEVLSAHPSMNHYGGIYCKLYFWKSVKKVNVQDFWEDEYPSYDTFSSYSGHLKINLNVKVWMKMHYMLHSNHMIITHNLKQLWFPKYFCTPSRLDTHWPTGPLRSNHIIWWWKGIIFGKSPCDGKSLLIFNIRNIMRYHHMMWSHH